MKLPVSLMRLALSFSASLLLVQVLLLVSETAIPDAAQDRWMLRMIPYFLFWVPIWFLFTHKGRQFLVQPIAQSETSSKRSILGRTITVLLASIMLGAATFLLILLFYLFSWGELAAVWLGENLAGLVGVMILLSVPAASKIAR